MSTQDFLKDQTSLRKNINQLNKSFVNYTKAPVDLESSRKRLVVPFSVSIASGNNTLATILFNDNVAPTAASVLSTYGINIIDNTINIAAGKTVSINCRVTNILPTYDIGNMGGIYDSAVAVQGPNATINFFLGPDPAGEISDAIKDRTIQKYTISLAKSAYYNSGTTSIIYNVPDSYATIYNLFVEEFGVTPKNYFATFTGKFSGSSTVGLYVNAFGKCDISGFLEIEKVVDVPVEYQDLS